MAEAPTFQDAIFRLQQFWRDEGCVFWLPINTEVGAGTMNPATFLHVLGRRPWNVAYVEPSVRPDDSRYGDNPNRLQTHTQFQVILKPDTGQPVEQYLRSLAALGIDSDANDIRFVEDNWESPALGAWGLGWEVWYNGLEITQFTYFQQAGGESLDPVSVEITYGLERILMSLQRKTHFKDIQYSDDYTVGELFARSEYEMSRYYLDVADIETTRHLFAEHEREAQAMLDLELAVPAYRQLLALSHTFNVLDARGAVGVTERAGFFARMRRLSRECAALWLRDEPEEPESAPAPKAARPVAAAPVDEPATALLVVEIGTEELPAADVGVAVEAMRGGAAAVLTEARLDHGALDVRATPRRLVLTVPDLATRQPEVTETSRGPLWDVAFEADGAAKKPAEGFARRYGLTPDRLLKVEHEGRQYVAATVVTPARRAVEVIGEALPGLLASISFRRSMRWNESGVAYSRPIRWITALLGDQVVPFEYAGVESGRVTRGLRSQAGQCELAHARDYEAAIEQAGITLDHDARRGAIWERVVALAEEAGGEPPATAQQALLDEVADLVEAPTPIRGNFDERFLVLPPEVLQTVMVKHQRFFPILRDQSVASSFVAVANGNVDQERVREGNEAVIRARYSDAEFFFANDQKRPLEDYRDRLATLAVHEKLGSMLDKAGRIEELTAALASELALDAETTDVARRTARLAKNDLVTEMVTEFSGLAGVMGGYYAANSGETAAVAEAIRDHVRPVDAGDSAPDSVAGGVVGLADRLDSLVGLFAAGVRARSDSDPYGLRRAAHGVISIVVNLELDFELDVAVRQAEASLPAELRGTSAPVDVLAFVWRRLEVWMRGRGLPADAVVAAIEGTQSSILRKVRVTEELVALQESSDFLDVLTGWNRASRIARGKERSAIDPELFATEYEHTLYRAYEQVREAPGLHRSVADFTRSFRPLVDPINDLFDNVFVAGEDAAAANRLALLGAVADLALPLANLNALQVSATASVE